MKIVYRLEALRDLAELLNHIACDSPAYADQVGQRIVRSISRQEVFPKSGRMGQTPDTFELVIPRLPYIAVYSVRLDLVEIVSIFHTSTDRPRGHQ